MVDVGKAVDLVAPFETLIAIGYTADELDEPGEVPLRGRSLDVFPADAGEPIRIEADDRRIVAVVVADE